MKIDLGGKANGLNYLKSHGFNIPDYHILNAEESLKINIEKIISIKKKLGGELFAIRSSATIEDTKDGSFAGLFDTYLGLQSEVEIKDAIINVANSYKNKRIKEYSDSRNIDLPKKPFVNVIIQKMIDPLFSGVMLSFSPNSRKDEILIESIRGLGELLVSGKVEPYQTFINRKNGLITCEKKNKQRYLLNKKGLVKISYLDNDQGKLTKSKINELYSNLIQLEKKTNQPLDIEFCISEDNIIYYLQSRPLLSS